MSNSAYSEDEMIRAAAVSINIHCSWRHGATDDCPAQNEDWTCTWELLQLLIRSAERRCTVAWTHAGNESCAQFGHNVTNASVHTWLDSHFVI